ncbi:FMP41 [Symbiodinium sp. KB8]|nr:FMP41 [Symbiodinium sp. KB8]
MATATAATIGGGGSKLLTKFPPRTIYAIGRNYVAHAKELGNQVPDEPVVFNKTVGSLAADPNKVRFPSGQGEVHHELEVVLVVGEHLPMGKYQGPDCDCIAGVTLGLDFTLRDVQSKLKAKGLPWHLAKNFQDATIVFDSTKALDVDTPITFQLHKNGKLVQDGDTELLIFPFHSLLKFINSTVALHPGDYIFTGTPAGVGPVHDGDVLQVVCDSMGINETVEVHFE